MMIAQTLALVWASGLGLAAAPSVAAADSTPAEKGYRALVDKTFVPSFLDQEIFDNLWTVWEEPLRSKAEKADAKERRSMTLTRYGLTERPGEPGAPPLQFGAQNGKWATNCFSCHGGKVAGKVIPGLPNSHIALATLFQDVHKAKRAMGRSVGKTESGTTVIPMGNSNGTTNAVIFGVLLAAFRDHDLNVDLKRPVPKMVHNDHDAPPWWHYKRKNFLYSDGFAGKGHRSLMQFMMTPENSAAYFHESEADFKNVQAFIESVEPPKYPYPVDQSLAAKGRLMFNKTCAECHGTYGKDAKWPAKIVALEEIGTDRTRLDSLTPVMRQWYKDSWFGEYGVKDVIADPGGYVAQPLDGIWATAPYLHNGSVPTLWHLFHPDQRPVVWKRTEDGYDQKRVGIEVQEFKQMPDDATLSVQRRQYFNSKLPGKGNQGHDFPSVLSEDEKTAVMEYLKTL